MKKILLFSLFSIISVAMLAQNYQFLPSVGKVLNYVTKVESPMQEESVTIYGSQRVEKKSNEKVSLIVEVFTDAKRSAVQEKQEISFNIENGNYVTTIKEFSASQLGQLGSEVNVIKESGKFSYPVVFSKESVLSNASATLGVNVQGMDLVLDMSYENRKVIGEEKVTVPAGEFNCLKVSEDIITEVNGQEQVTSQTYWLADGVGVVKQIVSSMNGLISVTSELESIK